MADIRQPRIDPIPQILAGRQSTMQSVLKLHQIYWINRIPLDK